MRCSFKIKIRLNKIKIWYYETLPLAIVVGGFCFVKGATVLDLRIIACRVALTKKHKGKSRIALLKFLNKTSPNPQNRQKIEIGN